MKWFQNNFKKIIYTAFLIPIFLVAIVSISHVTQWYGISNPISWSLYLSVGIEIAALSALAAIAAKMGRKVYFPFIIVTLIQFLGNIFFAYSYIDLNSKSFKDWVDMVDPIVSFMGVESGDMIGHKRFLALFAGGLLPLISLSFLHMLIKFEEEDRKQETNEVKEEKNIPSFEIVVESPQQEKNEVLDRIVEENQKNDFYDPPWENPLISDEKITEQSNENLSKEESVAQENIVKNFDIDEISKEAGRLEAEMIGEAFVPSEEFLQQLELELKKIEESKIEEPQIEELKIEETKIEEPTMEITLEETLPKKTKKVLSYTRRDA